MGANSAEGIRKRLISSSSSKPKIADKPTGADGDAIHTAKGVRKWGMRKEKDPEDASLRMDWARYFRPEESRCWGSTLIDGSTGPPKGGGAISSNRNADVARRYRPNLFKITSS